MESTSQGRFAQVLAYAAGDGEYRELAQRYEELDLPFLAVMEKLTEEDREIVTEYLRAVGASALRLTEIACEHMK